MFPITIPFIPLVESHLHRCGMHCHVHACIQKRVRTAECRMEHSMVLHLQHTCHARYSFGIAHLVHEMFDSGSIEVNNIIGGTVCFTPSGCVVLVILHHQARDSVINSICKDQLSILHWKPIDSPFPNCAVTLHTTMQARVAHDVAEERDDQLELIHAGVVLRLEQQS